MQEKQQQLYIGLMSGTSLDSIDAVLADFSNGIEVVTTIETEIPNDIRLEIQALNHPQHNDLARSLTLDIQLAELFSETAIELLKKNHLSSRDIIAIGSHGQTLRHNPDGKHGYTLQIGNPSVIAEKTAITVVADFRARDIAAGGQGAPLVPAFHHAAFYDPDEKRAIINIGGMANITLLTDKEHISGFDTGPGNVLMNYWCQKNTGKTFDKNGAWAGSGITNKELLQKMLKEPFFNKAPPKSTGRELFDAHWLENFNLQNIKTEDVQATLLELTARTICDSLPSNIDAIYVCGGGAKNNLLMQKIALLSNKPTSCTTVLGISPEWIEATAFAWLARQTINHLPGNIPEATGAKGKRVLGGIYFHQ